MSNQLAKLRKQRNLTQKQLAEAAGITRNYISKIENGSSENISLKVLSAIAKKLDVKMDDIFLT
jgi:transcriptional regulator with XRE-family HTH domain